MRRPLQLITKPRYLWSQSVANQTYSIQAAANITASGNTDQQAAKAGIRRKFGNRNNNNQIKKAARSKRAAAPAMRRISRPIPAEREINELKDTSRPPAETLGAGFHTGTKLGWSRPMIPRPIMVTAKIAWHVLAMRIGSLQG